MQSCHQRAINDLDDIFGLSRKHQFIAENYFFVQLLYKNDKKLNTNDILSPPLWLKQLGVKEVFPIEYVRREVSVIIAFPLEIGQPSYALSLELHDILVKHVFCSVIPICTSVEYDSLLRARLQFLKRLASFEQLVSNFDKSKEWPLYGQMKTKLAETSVVPKVRLPSIISAPLIHPFKSPLYSATSPKSPLYSTTSPKSPLYSATSPKSPPYSKTLPNVPVSSKLPNSPEWLYGDFTDPIFQR